MVGFGDGATVGVAGPFTLEPGAGFAFGVGVAPALFPL